MQKKSRVLQSSLPIVVLLSIGFSACVSRRPRQVTQANTPVKDADTTAQRLADSTQTNSTTHPATLAGDSTTKGNLGHISMDSTKTDSLGLTLRDSIPPTDSTASSPASMLDDIVAYKAQDSVVLLGTNLVYLFGPSTVDYKQQGLEANYMRMNTDSNLVYAHYVLDSLGRPTAHPKFKDGSDQYEAKSMNYNFKTNKGFITGVVTQQGEGYVTAERTKKVDEQCMYMEGGKYTTCDDHDHPHFYLNLTRAKVRNGKNIVAGPSYLVLLGVPLPIGLPFGFFPFSSRYSSGILMPSYGEETTRGLYLRNGGYYFAINDYVDFQVTADWYSLGSWGVNAQSRYRKRYGYSGNFNLNYLVTKQGDKDVVGDYTSSKDFRINWTHTQDDKANPSQQFSASVNFSTSSYNHNSLSTLYNPMVSGQNTKSSSINYSKTFTGTPFRLSASVDATQTSIDSMVTMSLPNLSISMNRIFPFKRKRRVGSERWYEKISLSYSGQFRNSISTKENRLFKSNLIKDWQNGMSHNIPISASYKLFDYIDLTLSASYNERWYTSRTIRSYDSAGDSIRRDKVYGFNRSYDFNTSASLSTTFYGFFQPWRLFGDKVQMIRHRITPRIGISYTPDFGQEGWGTWRNLEYVDNQGRMHQEQYSLYEGQIFGYAGRGKSASINFSLDNNIEAKIRSKADTVNPFRKVSIIDNFSVSSSYNLAADSFQLSDINARLNLKLTKSLNLNLSGSFDPYLYGHTVSPSGAIVPHRVNKLRILNGKGFGSLRSTGTSFSYTFNNETFGKIRRFFTGESDDKDKNKGNRENKPTNEDPTADTSMGAMAAKKTEDEHRGSNLYGNYEDTGEYDAYGYLRTSMPWNLSVSYGVNVMRSSFDPNRDEYNYRLSHSLMFSGSLQPTKNWSFNFNASYDFEMKKLANLTIGISRDLHCWSLTASAIPFGPYKSYNLTIGVKSSLLRDLKWDKHSYPETSTWY